MAAANAGRSRCAAAMHSTHAVAAVMKGGCWVSTLTLNPLHGTHPLPKAWQRTTQRIALAVKGLTAAAVFCLQLQNALT